jgi:hypothetical protein
MAISFVKLGFIFVETNDAPTAKAFCQEIL